MKDKHNNHDQHSHNEPPHEHHEKPKKEKHRRKRHGGLILVLILIIVILILFLLLFNPFGWGGGSGFLGNKGNESGDNTGSTTSSVISDTSSEISDTVIIKISENTITIDGEECADENALKEKVMTIGTSKKYELDHSTAIKETYDKVKAVMTELQDALNIEVNYNE